MNRYLLDTNHLSAYLDRDASVEQKVDDRLRAGDRVGLCLPVLCEYRAGIRLGRRYQRNLSRLNAALGILRLWPIDEETATEFAELFQELRAAGRVMSQFDLLIAALARQRKLKLLRNVGFGGRYGPARSALVRRDDLHLVPGDSVSPVLRV